MTYGNAVYMVDALTGEKIWSWSGSDDGGTRKTTNTEMKHSVVGGITALDRNDNGTIDHIYFADLGGQIFRIDLKEGATGTAMTHRLVKVFDANAGITLANHIPFRFYERPIVSFYDNAIDERFAAISIASGDRSSPLSEDRSVADSDRVYSIFDRDVAQQALFGNLNLLTNNLTTASLTELPFARAADRLTIVQPMQTATRNNTLNRNVYGSQGWYYPLNRFDGNGNVANVKSVGEGMVIGGFYYMTAYAPQMDYGEANSCTAKVKGGSERQLYCMPYGVCNMKAGNDYMSANGTGGFTRAGPGIQELVLGAVDANQRNTRVLLGNFTITELAAAANRYDFGTGPIVTDLNQLTGQLDAAGNRVPYDKTKGDGSSPLPIFAEGFRLVPNRWYELQNNK
jgi:type IV pilus assembly protein PilY1